MFPCERTLSCPVVPFVSDHNNHMWLCADQSLSCMQPLYNTLFWSFFELITLTNLLLSQFLHNSLHLPVVPVEGLIGKTKPMSSCPFLLPQGRIPHNRLGSWGWLKVKMFGRLTVTCIRMTKISHCTQLRTVALQKITLSPLLSIWNRQVFLNIAGRTNREFYEHVFPIIRKYWFTENLWKRILSSR